MLALGALAGCSPEPEGAGAPLAVSASAWGRPPEVVEAKLVEDLLTVRGHAEAGARVVFREAQGDAHAVVADAAGRFVLPIKLKAGFAVIRPEIQRGQETAPAPERLFIVRSTPHVIALLRNGRATRRLSPGPALDAIDASEGSALISGRATAPVELVIGADTETVTPRGGRWAQMISVAELAGLRVDGEAYAWPGAASSIGVAERAGPGWRIGWTDDAGARQTTWLPDA